MASKMKDRKVRAPRALSALRTDLFWKLGTFLFLSFFLIETLEFCASVFIFLLKLLITGAFLLQWSKNVQLTNLWRALQDYLGGLSGLFGTFHNSWIKLV